MENDFFFRSPHASEIAKSAISSQCNVTYVSMVTNVSHNLSMSARLIVVQPYLFNRLSILNLMKICCFNATLRLIESLKNLSIVLFN